ncbi:restriction endonuclease subunit S [Clostridium sp. AUH-JLR23]|uniref:restriction endonuclease subunit S n=1 Tax=Clostridium sp. AUH-JLR23 TaxID=1505062 RepID=UPI0035686DF2
MFGYINVKLSDIAEYSKDRIDVSELNEENYISVENLLQNKRGKTKASTLPSIGKATKYMEKDILIGNIRPYLKKIWYADNNGGTNGDVLDIRVSDDSIVNSKFLFYVLSSDEFFEYNMQNAKGAKMPRGNKEAIMQYTFCLPIIEEQERIVSILDRFDTLCNDIASSLPAEIEARQKQHEYYRDKLLTFKEI